MSDKRSLIFNGTLFGITSISLTLYTYAFIRHLAMGREPSPLTNVYFRVCTVWIATLCSTMFYYQAFTQSYTAYTRRHGALPIAIPIRPIPPIKIGSFVLNSPAMSQDAISVPSTPTPSRSLTLNVDPSSMDTPALLVSPPTPASSIGGQSPALSTPMDLQPETPPASRIYFSHVLPPSPASSLDEERANPRYSEKLQGLGMGDIELGNGLMGGGRSKARSSAWFGAGKGDGDVTDLDEKPPSLNGGIEMGSRGRSLSSGSSK